MWNSHNDNNNNGSLKHSPTLQPAKQFGMTSTISLAGPRPKDIQKTEELRKALEQLDPWSARSLNSCRVSDEILLLVPNIENFRLALRSINLWAKKHGIYSNSLGYFGGVTWAILVARTCQLYPNATASTLVQKFFLVFLHWKWPHPVLLKRPDNVNLSLPVWDPRVNTSGRYHLMPIITPAHPQKNSTFNVSESTKEVILMEFNRGKTTTDEIMLGRASWDSLFEAPSFFNRYRDFIVLSVKSQAADDHLEWRGVVESKIRLLIGNLERNQHISLAHVNPKCFDHKKGGNNNISCSPNSSGNEEEKSQNAATGHSILSSSPYCSMWFIGLEFKHTENINVDLTESVQNFTELAMQHGFDIKMLKEGMSVEARHVKRKQLSQYLDGDFMKRERNSMDNHKSSNNAITTKRKRLSSEMQQNDAGSNGSSCKRPRVSESVSQDLKAHFGQMGENANGSWRYYNITTSESVNQLLKAQIEENANASWRYYNTTTPALQQQTPPTFNTGANNLQVDDVSDNSNGGAGRRAALEKRKQKNQKIFQHILLSQQNFSQRDASRKISNISKMFTKKLVNSAKDVLTLSRLQIKKVLAKVNKTSCKTLVKLKNSKIV